MIEIIVLTLTVNIVASVIAMFLGTLLAFKLYQTKKAIKYPLVHLTRTMMAMPPVVLGLVLFLCFKLNGPLGFIPILYTPIILVLAQILLITPIVCGNVYQLLESKAQVLIFTLKMYQISKMQQLKYIVSEFKNELIFIFIVGFSRAVSEVGAVMIVGGNIKSETRMMTTAIANLKSQGNYEQAIVFGIVLILIAFIVQALLSRFKGAQHENF